MANSFPNTSEPLFVQAQLAALDAETTRCNGSSDLRAAETLLPLLLAAAPSERATLFQALLQRSTPAAIADVAFRLYDHTGREAYLLHAVALLEEWGAAAWPVLCSLAASPRPECELFVGLIARCRGVPAEERLRVLADLTAHPAVAVRSDILARINDFSPREVQPLLRNLASDSDPDLRAESQERLAVLGV